MNTPAYGWSTVSRKKNTGMIREAHEHVVGVDGDEVAPGHLHRIDVMIAERLDELLADHRRLRRAEVVEQEMNDSGGQVGNGVRGQHQADDQQGDRQRHAIGDLVDDAPTTSAAAKPMKVPTETNSKTRWLVG